MAKRKLTQERAYEIRDAFLQWQQWQSSETSEQLAERLGISRARLYSLKNNNWLLASTKRAAAAAEGDDGDRPNDALLPTIGLVTFLVDQLANERARVLELERELQALRHSPAQQPA